MEAERARLRLAAHWRRHELLALGEAPDVGELEAELREAKLWEAEQRTSGGVLKAVRARLGRGA